MKPKHILLIMSDQCRADALGPYGNTYAQTPALDAIADGAIHLGNRLWPELADGEEEHELRRSSVSILAAGVGIAQEADLAARCRHCLAHG